MIGRLSEIVLDCPDPRRLAEFYAAVLGMEIVRVEQDWITIAEPGQGAVGGPGKPVRLAFQLAPDHRPPRWPDPDHPQQSHLDIRVDDIGTAEPRLVALGATPLHAEDHNRFRVYADPAGHPLCLVWD